MKTYILSLLLSLVVVVPLQESCADSTALSESNRFSKTNALTNLPTPGLNAKKSNENCLFALLVSTNRREGLSATMELREQSQQLRQKLLAIVGSTNSTSQKLPAVVILGELRAIEAAPILAQHLEWDTEAKPIVGVTAGSFEKMSLEFCPVRIALEEIGEPAISPLLERIRDSDDGKITQKCVLICQTIEGADVTEFRLQGLLKKERDPKKKARIQSALEVLEKIKRGEGVL